MIRALPLCLGFLALVGLTACSDDADLPLGSNDAANTDTGETSSGEDEVGTTEESGSEGATAGQESSSEGETGSETGSETETGSGAELSVETLAIGDSVLEWNLDEGASIPEVWGEAAGLEVENAAVGGAMILDGEDGIPSQYEPGEWGRVLVNGGANDIGPDGCGCGDCMEVVDALVSPDASEGATVELVQQITGDGAHVVLLGYYTVSPESEFEGCEDELAALSERYAALAAGDPMVHFVDAAEVMDYTATPEFYDEDLIHPSIEGSEAVGQYIAEQVNGG